MSHFVIAPKQLGIRLWAPNQTNNTTMKKILVITALAISAVGLKADAPFFQASLTLDIRVIIRIFTDSDRDWLRVDGSLERLEVLHGIACQL